MKTTTDSKVKETIRLRCHLRSILLMAAEQNRSIQAAVQMGVIKVLDDLDKLARADDCPPAIRERLDALGIGVTDEAG